MSAAAANAFGVTTRFRNGVNLCFLDNMKKYFKKCHMVYCVREEDGDKAHLHFQVWYDKPRAMDDTRKTFKRIIEKTPGIDYQFPHCLKVVAAYDDNYYKEYCQKSIKEIIYNSVNQNDLSKFVYSFKKKKDPKAEKKPLLILLKEECKGVKDIQVISGRCIEYCITNDLAPRRDMLKNLIWWVWMGNRDDNYRGMFCFDELKDKLKSPTKY